MWGSSVHLTPDWLIDTDYRNTEVSEGAEGGRKTRLWGWTGRGEAGWRHTKWLQMEQHEHKHAEESIQAINISCQSNICQGLKRGKGKCTQRKKRGKVAVGWKHQRNHQCETLPCPWQLRLRTAQQLMHHRVLSQRHIRWKVGQNNEGSGNYQWISSHRQWTMTHSMWDLFSQQPVKTLLFSGSHHASTITMGGDYMNLNLPQFNTSVDPRWLLSLKGK